MADQKITDLVQIVTISSDDVLPIVDISDNITKKIDITQIKAQSPVQSVNATTGNVTVQATLVSGTNIKTINSTSLLGSGDVAVQATLVSGTNIKTINSTSILGSGNLVVAATPSGVSGAVQFSDGSALASDATNFFWDDTNNRLGIGTNAPAAKLSVKGVGTTTATTNTQWLNSSNSAIGSLNDAGNISFTGKGSFGNAGSGSILNVKGSGATNATKSILVQNSATTETFSISDSGIGLISDSLGINGGVGGSTYLGQTMRLAVNEYSRLGNIRIGGGLGTDVFGYIQTDSGNQISFGTLSITFCSSWIASTNNLKLGTVATVGRLQINTLATTTAAVVLQAQPSQTEVLEDHRSSADVRMSAIGAKGEFYFGSGTVSASAAIQADSTTQGFLMPRMTTTQRDAIATPATGLSIYNTTTNSVNYYNGTAWEDTKLVVTNRQTASYTLAITDANKLVEINNASANNLTVPLNSSVAYSIGTQILLAQYGAGQTTVVATVGVTVRSSGGKLKLNAQYSGATLIKIATDEWYLFGDISV
jgi:hypothetical protein